MDLSFYAVIGMLLLIAYAYMENKWKELNALKC